MPLKQFVRNYLKKIGIDIVRYYSPFSPHSRIAKIFSIYNIDVVLDIGANVGQYAKRIRNMGYREKIISFEPLSSAYKELKKSADSDSHWETFNFALGDINNNVEINISDNSKSSSILDILPNHIKSSPKAKYIGKEQIEIKTLDSIFDAICSKGDNIYLKIDTQGFEKKVIDGAMRSLAYIDTIQLEMSMIPLYKDELLFTQMYELLYQKKYRLVSIDMGFTDQETLQLLQVDGTFHRFDNLDTI